MPSFMPSNSQRPLVVSTFVPPSIASPVTSRRDLGKLVDPSLDCTWATVVGKSIPGPQMARHKASTTTTEATPAIPDIQGWNRRQRKAWRRCPSRRAGQRSLGGSRFGLVSRDDCHIHLHSGDGRTGPDLPPGSAAPETCLRGNFGFAGQRRVLGGIGFVIGIRSRRFRQCFSQRAPMHLADQRVLFIGNRNRENRSLPMAIGISSSKEVVGSTVWYSRST